jgi:hypothetical protein
VNFEAIFSQVATEMTTFKLEVMLPRMVTAAAIGTALALRPWRFLMRRPLPKTEMIHAQILLCAAAAVITAVIGDSLAKAFGLVGLGSFVRFRSGLKDPRDAAILFLIIGLGMACGHGAMGLAFVGTGFVGVLLFLIDVFSGKEEADAGPALTLAAETDDPAGAESALRKAFSEKNILVKRAALDFPNRRLEVDVEGADVGRMGQLLSAQPEGPLRQLRWTLCPAKPQNVVAPQEEAR